MSEEVTYTNFEDWSEGILENLRGLRVKASKCLGSSREGDLVLSFITSEGVCAHSEIPDKEDLSYNDVAGKSVYFYPRLKISIPINEEETKLTPLTNSERKDLASFIRQRVFYPRQIVEMDSIHIVEDEDKKNIYFAFSDFDINKEIETSQERSATYETEAMYDVDSGPR